MMERTRAAIAWHGLAAAIALAVLMTGQPAVAGPAQKEALATVAGARADRSVPAVTIPQAAPVPDAERDAVQALPPARWPATGVAEVGLRQGHAARAGSLPVEVSPLAGEESPSAVRVEWLEGPALRVSRLAGGAGRVRVAVDYSAFRYAFGGNYADRLRLWRGADPVPAENDLAAGRLTALVEPGTYELAAAASGTGTGDYRATDLLPSGKWQVGLMAGSFTDAYPLALPPSIGADTPELALGYDSASVDGRTSATNNQASWVGLGWNLGVGFIERKYKSCVADGDPYHADLCWSSPFSGEEDGAAYVMSLDGVTTELIRTADGSYRMRDDRGWRIEHRTGGPNADNTGEYWVVSTSDGDKHTFGYRSDSNFTVPVVGDDTGEPCRSTAPVPCRQTWRWGLDKVVDVNENVASFYWTKETNNYKQANGGATYKYDRGGYLDRVEYGGLDGEHPAAQVDFTATPRCTQRVANPATACPAATPAAASSYPDVPVDLICADGAACTKVAPSFFLTSRLELIETKVWNTSTLAWQPVTRWTPRFAFPATPDGSSASLWLNSIQQSGVFGSEPVTLPPTTFDGIFLNNRQDYTSTAQQLQMRRLSVIRNGIGGEVRVTYGHGSPTATCPAGGQNSGWEAGMMWDQNRYECFRVRFKPEGATAPTKGVFHKYVVTKVDEVDLVGGSPTMTTAYGYGIDQLVPWPAWHRDDDLLAAAADMDWTDWRGYQTVRITEGSAGADRQTITDHRYFRGMNGDLMGSGTPKSETVRDYAGTAWTDDPQKSGLLLQTQRYRRNADGTLTELESQRHTYWDSGVIADGPGLLDVRMVREAYTYSRDRRADNTWRETSTLDDGYTVANGGLPRRKTDFGETGVADSICTEITYAQNTAGGNWILDLIEREETHAGDPDAASVECPGPIIDRTVTLYDGAAAPGDGINEPTDGNPTEIRSYTADTVYNAVRHTYDGYGRERTETDAAGTTTTSYTPVTGFPTGGIAVTDPMGMVTTTFPARAFEAVSDRIVDANGLVTEQDHDGLGRLRKVWLPTEPRNLGVPSHEFSYRLTAGKPSVVTAKQLQSLSGTGAGWLTSYTYLDGLGRTREVHAASPGPSGGRTVAVTLYDDRGLNRGESAPMWNATAPADDPNLMLNPATTAIPSWTESTFDALERESATTVFAFGAVASRTATAHFGNGTVVTPPVGASTGTWLDGHDRTVTIQRDLPAGASLPQAGKPTTTYTYHPGGELKSVTDPSGNVSSYGYDWLGQRLTAKDPNAGSSTTTYDTAGRLKSTVDAKGQVITYTYDGLDRRRAAWSGAEQSGVKLAEWTYDTVPGAKGQLATATRFAGGNAYTVAVTDYDERYRVTGRRWSIPGIQAGLTDTFEFGYGYDRADHQTSISYPAAGGLPAETVQQTYTATGLAATLSSGLATYVQGTTYTGSGRLDTRAYGAAGSVRRRHTFEEGGARRLTGLVTTAGTTVAQDDILAYDAAGNPQRIQERLVGQSSCFSYDSLQRLAASWTTAAADCSGGIGAADSSGPDPYREQYSYNATDNLAAVTSGSTTRTYTYPASGPASVRPHAITAIGADSYGYDANGAQNTRTVAGVTTTSDYDEFGRLRAATTGGATTSFEYGADGTRLLRREPAATTVYLDNTELRRTPGGVAATRYYRTGDGGLIGQRTAAGVTWLFTDEQDTVQLSIADGAAALTATGAAATVSRQRYLPYGGHRGGRDDITATEQGYLGKVEDSTTRLVALDNRQHDPAVGALTSPDPLMDLSDPAGQNAYTYANANPVTHSDPSGLKICGARPCPGSGGEPPRKVSPAKARKAEMKNRAQHRAYSRRGTCGARPCPGYGGVPRRSSSAKPRRSSSGCHGWECNGRPAPKPKLKRVGPDLLLSLTQPSKKSQQRFLEALKNKKQYDADWSFDGCTNGPERPLGFNFTAACRRHDFGYHNARANGVFTEAAKHRIDRAFWWDMARVCKAAQVCLNIANHYYAAVFAFGGRDAR